MPDQRQRQKATIAAPSAPASHSTSHATISCQADRGLVLFFRNIDKPVCASHWRGATAFGRGATTLSALEAGRKRGKSGETKIELSH
jgi:hypothetical protein